MKEKWWFVGIVVLVFLIVIFIEDYGFDEEECVVNQSRGEEEKCIESRIIESKAVSVRANLTIRDARTKPVKPLSGVMFIVIKTMSHFIVIAKTI